MEKINKIYTNPKNPGSYSSAEALIKAVKAKYPDIPRKEVLYFLEGNRTATLFKQARKKFPRSRTVPTAYLSGEFIILFYLKIK